MIDREATGHLEIRPMAASDVDAACALADEAGWRSRRAFYELVLRLPTCRPLVGLLDGQVVATGVATISPPVGWVGTIVVAAALRGRGFGREMTLAVSERLRAAGCEPLALIATALGRPLYERLGFRIVTRYHLLQGDHVTEPPAPPAGARLRPIVEGDLAAIFELDAQATAEDRRVVLAALVQRSQGWLLESASGLRAFLLPAERGYAPIVAPRPDDARCMLALHRHLAPDGGHARAGIPEENPAWRTLLADGWTESWIAPRMQLGPDVPWRSDWIWGQISFAMG